MKSGHFAFSTKWQWYFRKKGIDDKTAHFVLLDALKHEITVNDVQNLSRYCQKSIQETQGDKLISESGPDVEPEPDDHLGFELGSGSIRVSEPDMEPGRDDDQNEWQVLFWHLQY